MNDTISRQAVMDAINRIECTKYTTWYEFYQKVITAVGKLPPAEPKRGKWFYQKGMIKCDQCLRAIRRIDHDGLLNFCPNCGVDMREVTT